MAERSERGYRLEPLDSSGVFLGLGAIQCVLLGAGMLLAVGGISAGLPIVLAVVPVALGLGLCFARAAGRPLWAWLPVLASWGQLRMGRGRRWAPPLPLWTCTTEPGPSLPPCLAGLEIIEVAWRTSGSLGAVRDKARGTLTASVTVRGPQFVVEPRSEQDRLLAGWGDVLAQFAVERGAVAHLSWSDLARPSGMHQHRDWAARRTAEAPNQDAADSYRELLDLATASAISHQTVVSITVAADRLGRRSGDRDQLERALATAVDALLRGLRSAGLTAEDPFSPAGLQRLLRERLDPSRPPQRHGGRGGRLADRLTLVTAATAGPLALESSWSHVRVDRAWHRTWWIGTWPRLAQPPGWLEPFLSGGGLTRTMTVYLHPVAAHQSRRRIERDLVKLESDAATREERGRRVDARHRRATQALLDREDELVAGYPEVAYAGLVTVSASSLEELDDHGEILEQLARESGMDLRPLDARQDLAWAAALPLGLAPSTVLASS